MKYSGCSPRLYGDETNRLSGPALLVCARPDPRPRLGRGRRPRRPDRLNHTMLDRPGRDALPRP